MEPREPMPEGPVSEQAYEIVTVQASGMPEPAGRPRINPSWEQERAASSAQKPAAAPNRVLGAMNGKGLATDAMARHLHAAIERVREDVAKVEFWADAMSGFTAPVPDYESKDMKVWLPPEQATRISSTSQNVSENQSGSLKRG